MSERLTKTEFARRADCDEKQVRRAIASGKLVLGDDGRLDASQLATTWRKVTARSKSVRAGRTLSDRPDKSAAKCGSDDGDGESLHEALLRKEQAQADLKRLEFQEKSGALTDTEHARQVLFEEARAARDAWLNWPAKIGPLLAAQLNIDDAPRIVELLTEHVHQQVTALGGSAADFERRGR